MFWGLQPPAPARSVTLRRGYAGMNQSLGPERSRRPRTREDLSLPKSIRTARPSVPYRRHDAPADEIPPSSPGSYALVSQSARDREAARPSQRIWIVVRLDDGCIVEAFTSADAAQREAERLTTSSDGGYRYAVSTTRLLRG